MKVSNEVEATTDKVDKLSVDNNRERGNRRNRNKKPEQPHYSAKKVTTTPTGNVEGVTTELEAGNVKEGNNNGSGLNVVVGKPPVKACADDGKSDGGGSNTGTGRRKHKNKNRPLADSASVTDSHDPQVS